MCPTENNRIRLVISDLDGTLFGRDHTISKPNLEAIRAATDAGIRFMICTGRPVQDIYDYIYRYDLAQVGIIGMNGCCRIDGAAGRVEFVRYFEDAQWRDCVEIIRAFPVQMVVSGTAVRDGILWRDYPTEFEMMRSGGDMGRMGFVPPRDGAHWQNGVNKLICFAEENAEVLQEVRRALHERHPALEIRSSWVDNIEIMPPGCNKGTAVEKIAEEMGVSLDSVMVLGDNENDIPMLERTPNGVCMSNGTDMAKAVCRHVVENGDACGVARAIRTLALGQDASRYGL